MKTRRAIALLIIFTLVELSFIAGCGSDKKKGESDGDGRISGRIITPDAAPSPRLGIELPEKVMVRLYELDKSGEKVRPIEGVEPEDLLPDNRFSFSGVPGEMSNLIVRVELEDSQPVAAALVPSVPEIGSSESEIIVSGESDLEVEVFMEIVKTGFQQAADTDPAQIDTVFLKTVIGPETVTAEGASATTLVPDFAAAAKAAILEYSRALTGEEKPPSNPTINTVRKAMLNADAEYQLALEDSFYLSRQIDPERLSQLHRALRDAEAEAMEGISLPAREMPEAALLARARRARAARFAECLRKGKDAEGCPIMKSKQNTRDAIADAFEASSGAIEATYSIWKRRAGLAGVDGKPSTATSTADAGMPFTAFSRLINLPQKTEAVFHDTIRRNWAEISATEPASPERKAAIGRMRARLRNMRNYLLTTYLAASPDAILQLENGLLHAGERLSVTSRNRKSTSEAVEEEWLRFQELADGAFQPMSALVDSRFTQLDQNDRKKIYWAAREITLLTLLFDLDSEQYAPADSDGDGSSNSNEKALGTNPTKNDSRPAPPLASSPSASLPAPPADADNDGIADAAEMAAGTDPDRPNSTPDLSDLMLCTTIEPIKCQRPGDGMDNDNDGHADEELLDGLDNDGDYRVDEDSAKAPPETIPKTPPEAETAEEDFVSIDSEPESVSFAEGEEGAVEILSAPATATFATGQEATTQIEVLPATATFATDQESTTQIEVVPATSTFATDTTQEEPPEEPEQE
ncbi:MAG: thrombospondin type 3 repeat-containing protein [bacterium]